MNVTENGPVSVGVVGVAESEAITDVVGLAVRVLPVTIARDEARRAQQEQESNTVADVAGEVILRLGQNLRRALDQAHTKYLAEPSDANSRVLHKALRAVAYNFSYVVSKNWLHLEKESRAAAKHCLIQVSKYRPQEHKGRIIPFSTWACRVMRNKMRDTNRKIFRAERKKLRKEAKRDEQIAQNAIRQRQLNKRKFQTAFTPAEVAFATKQLRAKQIELLKLKSRTPRLPDTKLAAQLGITLAQLHNRWSRLRKKMKALLDSEVRRDRLFKPARPRWYPGAPCVYAGQRGHSVKGSGQSMAGRTIAIGES